MAFLDQKAENQPNQDQNDTAKDRLLDAAEHLFCENGYKGTSVRKIASAADCNLASVNYYFGGKEKLYFEVWHRQLKRLREARLESMHKVMSTDGTQPTLEEVLRSFAYSFLGPLIEDYRLIKLMTHEMLDTHLPADMFVEEVVKPTMKVMHQALLQTCSGLDEKKIPLLVFSIVGQLVHFIRIETMFEQTESVIKLDINEAVDHIVKFSAAGIRAYTLEDAE